MSSHIAIGLSNSHVTRFSPRGYPLNVLGLAVIGNTYMHGQSSNVPLPSTPAVLRLKASKDASYTTTASILNIPCTPT